MAVAASTIIGRVRKQLIDEGSLKRWSDTELLSWISDGQRAIVAYAPSAYSKTEAVRLAVGTKQTIPPDGHMLLGLTRNMGLDGTTPGRAIRVIQRDAIDAFAPDWHRSQQTQTIQNFIYDPQQQTTYYVYPPSNGESYVEIIYSASPPELGSAGALISLPDLYQTPLFDYVMFRALQKDADFGAGQAAAANYRALFEGFLQVAEAGELTENPNLGLGPANPGVKGAAK